MMEESTFIKISGGTILGGVQALVKTGLDVKMILRSGLKSRR